MSFYVEHGDWFVLACAAVAALGYAAIRFAPAPEVEEEATRAN
jgi:hypothetical protein